MPNFSLLLNVSEGAKGVGEGHRGIDAVELVEVDGVKTETAQGELQLLLEIIGAAAGLGFCWTLTGEAALGGNHKVCGVGIKSFGDEFFRDAGTIGVRGVKEGDTQLDGSTEDVARVLAIGRLTPRAFAYETNSAVYEAMDREITAEGESAGGDGAGWERGLVHGTLDARTSLGAGLVQL